MNERLLANILNPINEYKSFLCYNNTFFSHVLLVLLYVQTKSAESIKIHSGCLANNAVELHGRSVDVIATLI